MVRGTGPRAWLLPIEIILKSGEGVVITQVVTAPQTKTRKPLDESSPFLFADMPAAAPLNERARLERESKEFIEAVTTNGPLLLPSMAGRAVGVSPQRVSALIDEGKLSAVEFFGHRWVYLQQLQERQAAPRDKGGRPRKDVSSAA